MDVAGAHLLAQLAILGLDGGDPLVLAHASIFRLQSNSA